VQAVPDVPTVAESGYKGFEATTWFGVLVPKGTPEPMVNRLSAEIVKVLNAPDVRARMQENGGATVKAGPAEFNALLKGEMTKWARVVKESGVRVE
jgi:tripartite-type tricarboxylate transporter receptor subunit TctC